MQLRGIKLALLDEVKARMEDAKKQITNLNSANKQALDIIQNAIKVQDNLDSEYGFANSLTVAMQNAIDRTEKTAKEIGIDANMIAEIKQIKNLLQELDKAIVNADETRSKFRG